MTLKDCVLLALVCLALAVSLVACGGGGPAKEDTLRNGMQIRDIHQGMMLFGQVNGGYFPGLDANGRTLSWPTPVSPGRFDAPLPTDSDISYVYATLLNVELVSPHSFVHPVDVGKTVLPSIPEGSPMVTRDNFSYALLQFGGVGNEGRRYEWRDTSNSEAPLVADRSKMIDPTLATTGLFTSDTSGDPTNWKGSVGWGDNHVTFERSAILVPGAVKINGRRNKVPDNIFEVSDGADRNANAMVVY